MQRSSSHGQHVPMRSLHDKAFSLQASLSSSLRKEACRNLNSKLCKEGHQVKAPAPRSHKVRSLGRRNVTRSTPLQVFGLPP